ncbi:hypothetical protein [Pedobacter sp. UBA5917]|jgi:hypothetical protein|uniref:hypothetical protein n=1 Tax=Pedobacter sp. UBA5917 TaxID=1947061 RepID=UPI0025D3D13C|nr:hypothetical protein [Pedobacter sp. UBA5917]
MKNAPLILLVLIALCSYKGYTQIKTSISTVAVPQPDYESTLPSYTKDGLRGFYRYLSAEVTPLMSKEGFKNSGYPPTKLKMLLLINEQGNITDVGFPDESLTKACEAKIKAKFFKLKGWKAPVVNGKAIKSTFLCSINCILWQ